MSEKRAKRNRKNMPEQPVKKAKGSVWTNVVITLIIVVFLGLACYALKDTIKSILPEKPEKVPTVTDMAKERDMTVDEFMQEFGLEGTEATKDSTEQDLLSIFTVENYAKYQDKTTDELLSEYGIEGVTGDMLWQDAFSHMPLSKYAEMMGTTFDDLKAQSSLPEGVTAETTLGELQEMTQETPAETEETPAEDAE